MRHSASRSTSIERPRRFVERRIEKRGERPTEVRSEIREHVHRGFEGPVHLPPKLVGIVTAVIGLDNRRLGGPAGTGTGDPAGAQYLSPVTVAQLYDFPEFSAAGQTVGLFEAADDGAAYLHSDITKFIASLPAGFDTPPNLADIGLLGHTNNTAPCHRRPAVWRGRDRVHAGRGRCRRGCPRAAISTSISRRIPRLDGSHSSTAQSSRTPAIIRRRYSRQAGF